MSCHSGVCGLAVALLLAAVCRPAQAVVLWSQNFDQIATGSTYADSTTLSSAAGTTDDVTLRTSGTANSNFTLVDRGSGNHALQFTDNDSTQSTFPKANSANFSGTMSTTGTGNNSLSGSFSYTRLLSQTSSSTSPSFAFTATAPGSASGFDLEVTVENDGHLHYFTGNGAGGTVNTDSGVVLQTGTEYTFQFGADLSSSSQDKWSLYVATVASPQTALLNVSNLNTMEANFAIVQFSFWGGLNQAGLNSAAFAQVDNISFSANPVPEPASVGLVFVAGGGLLLRRKR